MISTLLFFLMAAPGAFEPVEWLDSNRVKVSTEIIRKNSGRAHASAQIKLMRMAKKACKPIGGAVSDGTLRVDQLEKPDSKRTTLLLSEVYVCITD